MEFEDKETGRDIIIGVGVEKDGHVKIQTEEEYLPTEVAQQVLDCVVAKIIHVDTDTATKKLLNSYRKECIGWRIVSGLITGALIFLALRLKGIL